MQRLHATFIVRCSETSGHHNDGGGNPLGRRSSLRLRHCIFGKWRPVRVDAQRTRDIAGDSYVILALE
jgi:hypothetical protein